VDLGQCLLCALFEVHVFFEGFAYWGTLQGCLLSFMGLDGSFVGGFLVPCACVSFVQVVNWKGRLTISCCVVLGILHSRLSVMVFWVVLSIRLLPRSMVRIRLRWLMLLPLCCNLGWRHCISGMIANHG